MQLVCTVLQCEVAMLSLLDSTQVSIVLFAYSLHMPRAMDYMGVSGSILPPFCWQASLGPHANIVSSAPALGMLRNTGTTARVSML